MARWSLFLILLSLPGCGSDDPAAAARVRDLPGALNPAPAPVDTAKQRADSQFQKCTYVYSGLEKLRECLVLTHGWTPQEAERAIARYEGQLRRVHDSLTRLRDSLVATERNRRLADRRRRDSIYLATHREQLDGPDVGMEPDPLPWMHDRRTGAYYRSSCEAARRVPLHARYFFRFLDEAKTHGWWPSREPECT